MWVLNNVLRAMLDDIRERLVRLESRLISTEERVERNERRLINVELKINTLLRPGMGFETADPLRAFPGHQHQAFGHLTYAQFGEDLIVANLFVMLGNGKPTYIDVGAHHPVDISNTALLHLRGSHGINIEANPDLFSAFEALRPNDVNLNIGIGVEPGVMDFYRMDTTSGRNSFSLDNINSFIDANPEQRITETLKVRVETLNAIVDQYCSGDFPDFLSIDVEGWDYDILNSADFSKSRPAVICVEAISGNDIDESERLISMLEGKGYELYMRTVANLIFLDNKSMEKIRGFRPLHAE